MDDDVQEALNAEARSKLRNPSAMLCRLIADKTFSTSDFLSFSIQVTFQSSPTTGRIFDLCEVSDEIHSFPEVDGETAQVR
jgi:hypothetical protein